jgi:ribosomal-protein-alanine N-acetyltransferase
MTELHGKRVTLRPVDELDADGPYLEWMHDAEITRYLEVRRPPDRSELRSYIRQMNADPATWFFAIVTEDETHIGNIKLGPIDHYHRRGDIGILIGERSSWGKGYATDAIATLSAWAFADLGLEKLTAGAYDANAGSIRAFQKAGFQIEGVRRSHGVVDGHRVDGVLLARFAPDLG